MKYPKVKSKKRKVTWEISEAALALVEKYAQFAERKEDEIVDEFLENLLDSPEFNKWIRKKRYRIRFESVLKHYDRLDIIQEVNINKPDIVSEKTEEVASK